MAIKMNSKTPFVPSKTAPKAAPAPIKAAAPAPVKAAAPAPVKAKAPYQPTQEEIAARAFEIYER